MTSTRLITIGRRASQYLAVTTFAIGLAVGSAAVASAEWDIEAYDKCMAKTVRDPISCCIDSGGLPGGPDWQSCGAPVENDAMTGQPAPPRSPEDIVTGPTRQFDVPDASVPGGPVIVFPTP